MNSRITATDVAEHEGSVWREAGKDAISCLYPAPHGTYTMILVLGEQIGIRVNFGQVCQYEGHADNVKTAVALAYCQVANLNNDFVNSREVDKALEIANGFKFRTD